MQIDLKSEFRMSLCSYWLTCQLYFIMYIYDLSSCHISSHSLDLLTAIKPHVFDLPLSCLL
jgi:hypothetical protein